MENYFWRKQIQTFEAMNETLERGQVYDSSRTVLVTCNALQLVIYSKINDIVIYIHTFGYTKNSLLFFSRPSLPCTLCTVTNKYIILFYTSLIEQNCILQSNAGFVLTVYPRDYSVNSISILILKL